MDKEFVIEHAEEIANVLTGVKKNLFTEEFNIDGIKGQMFRASLEVADAMAMLERQNDSTASLPFSNGETLQMFHDYVDILDVLDKYFTEIFEKEG